MLLPSGQVYYITVARIQQHLELGLSLHYYLIFILCIASVRTAVQVAETWEVIVHNVLLFVITIIYIKLMYGLWKVDSTKPLDSIKFWNSI